VLNYTEILQDLRLILIGQDCKSSKVAKVASCPLRALRYSLQPLSEITLARVNDENHSPVFSHDELMMVAGFPDHFIPPHAGPIATGVIRKKVVVRICDQFQIICANLMLTNSFSP
jgi:hypothetical protein